MQNLINEENYLNYLTHHAQSIEGATYVVNRWKDTPEFEKNTAIRLWVQAAEVAINFRKD